MAAVTDVTIAAGAPTVGTGTVATLSKFELPASTAPLATDEALIVSIRPDSPGVITTGTAGTPSAVVLTVQGIAASTPLRVANPLVAGAGVGLTWTDIFSTATLNSIASTNGILSDLAITNGTALDRYMDVSIALASAAFTGTGINISLHLYPLNADGSTYGDGKFGSSAAGPCAYPPVAVIPLVAATQAQTGSATGIPIPPGTFKLVFVNNGGVALAASGNTCKYRTYN